MALGRDTPPDPLQDGQFGELPGVPNSQRTRGQDPGMTLNADQARKLGREIYASSTNWLNAGRRAKWNDSLRAFQGLHPSGSKYLSSDYRYRSRNYRPKTRTMVRAGEAATAAAFFSNEDVVNITAENDDDPMQQASAVFMKELLQYRLTRTIPWFLTLLGARQDCDVMGMCVGKPYWKYAERHHHTENRIKLDDQGMPIIKPEGGFEAEDVDVMEVVEDRPCVDLIAPENFRFDPGADWRNPVSTSPYTIELIPMWVNDVREKCENGEWMPVSEGAIMASSDLDDDVTRRSREQGRVPGKDRDAGKPRDFDISWVRENIIRWGGRDWHFFTLGSAGELLTRPRPLEEVYLQGMRPYVTGFVVLEAHKTYPSSKVELVRDLQMMANDDSNLRFDNVKLALNPRQFIRSGQGIEITDVRTFMPGKVVVTKDPKNDIVWDRPPEVTASSYQEQDRINLDFDALAGSTATASTMASAQNPVVPDTVGGMDHIAAPGNTMNDYEMACFNVTFVEPLLRHLVKLEQAYETDATVMALAGQKAKLLQKFGASAQTDDLLAQELTIKVNVGVGATNPQMKLRNFLMGMTALSQIFSNPQSAMALNFEEVSNEIFSNLGYKDGDRFIKPGFDPMQALQQMAQMQGGGKQGQGATPDPHRVQAVQIQAQGKIQERQIQAAADERVAQIDFAKNQMSEQADTQRAQMDMYREFATDHNRLHMEAAARATPGHQPGDPRIPHPATHQPPRPQMAPQQPGFGRG